MPRVTLSCGEIEYFDTGGPGHPLVFLHGLVMDWRQWESVMGLLSGDFRCIAPVLPEGAHATPVRADFTLTPESVTGLVGEFLDALNLASPVLLENDSGRAQQFAAAHPNRLSGLVIASCEAFENYPPGVGGRMAMISARAPGGVWLMSRLLGFRWMRHSRLTFGLMSACGIPDDLLVSWLKPLRASSAIRRDFASYCSAVNSEAMQEAAEGLRRLGCPALVLWGAEDRMMPLEHGRRLAEIIPDSAFETITGSGTLIPLDQPAPCAERIKAFVQGQVVPRIHGQAPKSNPLELGSPPSGNSNASIETAGKIAALP